MTSTVFLSFAHEDETLALNVADGLKRRFDVFYATASLRAGHSLALIFDEIDRRDTFVVLFTPISKNSPWVTKEVSFAIGKEASGRTTTIVPVYVDLAEPYRYTADKCGLWVRSADPETILEKLLETLDQAPAREQPTFQNFVQNLIQLRGSAAWDVTLFRNDPKLQTQLRQKLRDEGVATADIERIAKALELKKYPPVIDRNHALEVRRWARRADPVHVRLAAKLFESSLQHRRGATLEAVRKIGLKLLKDEVPDPKVRSWRAECLAEDAKVLGLLSRASSEELIHTQQLARNVRDPGADWGIMTRIVGPLAQAYLDERHREVLGIDPATDSTSKKQGR